MRVKSETDIAMKLEKTVLQLKPPYKTNAKSAHTNGDSERLLMYQRSLCVPPEFQPPNRLS